MNRRAGFLIILLAAVFTFGLVRIFSVAFATGEVYPAFSSMRASPEGAKLLYDALSQTPGVTVSRNYFPLAYLDNRDTTILFLALNLGDLAQEPKQYERLARRGNRLVMALAWESKEKPKSIEDLEKRWIIKFTLGNGVHFQSSEWLSLEHGAIERNFENGSILLFAGSRDFSNTSTVQLNRLPLLSAALGPNSRIVFDEQHFGIAESGSVVGLARRFRLTGMALGLALCAALFIWKNSAAFPPAAESVRAETLSGRASISGLVMLLERHIRPADLAATCWNEWLPAHRAELSPAHRERAEAILNARGRNPLDAVRQIQTVFDSKGPF